MRSRCKIQRSGIFSVSVKQIKLCVLTFYVSRLEEKPMKVSIPTLKTNMGMKQLKSLKLPEKTSFSQWLHIQLLDFCFRSKTGIMEIL